ncbi:uncharacterized protein [Elaeis guineensis]|uniref:uncharacterized protein n=1 Tax=Elaeis guineensis var. tenera TaxID=51953 RepID=UPI003C6D0430
MDGGGEDANDSRNRDKVRGWGERRAAIEGRQAWGHHQHQSKGEATFPLLDSPFDLLGIAWNLECFESCAGHNPMVYIEKEDQVSITLTLSLKRTVRYLGCNLFFYKQSHFQRQSHYLE